MPGTTSTGCLTSSIGRVRVIEKSCVKFWTISQRCGDAARLAVGRADWLGRPACGARLGRWVAGPPDTHTTAHAERATHIDELECNRCVATAGFCVVVCRHCDSFPRTGTHVQIQEKAARARARARAYAQHAHSARLGPRCPPCSAVAGARHPMRWTPSAWSCVTPLPNGLRWMRVHGAGSAAVRRVAARCTPWPCHPAHSLQASPSALAFALWTGATAARGGTLATAGAGARLALRGRQLCAASPPR